MTLRTTVHCLIIAALARKHDDQYNKRLTDSEEGRNFGNHKVLKSFLMESGPTEHFRALSALIGPEATSIALPYFYPSNIICRSLPAALPPWSTLPTRTSSTDHITPALQQAFSQNQHGNLAPHSQGHSRARLSTVRSFTPLEVSLSWHQEHQISFDFQIPSGTHLCNNRPSLSNPWFWCSPLVFVPCWFVTFLILNTTLKSHSQENASYFWMVA